MVPINPQTAKDLAEEHERELLEEVEADKLAEGKTPADEYPSDDYVPVTDDEKDMVPPRRHNRHVHDEQQ